MKNIFKKKKNEKEKEKENSKNVVSKQCYLRQGNTILSANHIPWAIDGSVLFKLELELID